MRTVTPMQAEPDRRLAYEEILVVLMLSLLASAAYAVLSLLEAPVRGTVVASANQSTQLARQVAGFVFGLAPVFLVLYLVRRYGEGVGSIGLAWDRPRQDILRGVALFAVVGLAGLGLYLGGGRTGREPVRGAGAAARSLVDGAGVGDERGRGRARRGDHRARRT